MVRYFDHPDAFVRECFRWKEGDGPASYQSEVLAAFPTARRLSLRGPHGLGKSALLAWVILWFALTREAAGREWKTPTTASAWRQLTKYLWPEIHKWARRIDWDKVGFRGPLNERTELLTLSLKLSRGEAFALASDNPATIEGAHADELLYVFDESKIIPVPTWDSAEGAFSGPGNHFWLSASTPGEPVGRFYDIQRARPGYEDWSRRAVTLEEMIAAGRQTQEWADQRARQWGADSATYLNRVKGEFASSDEDGVIPLTWIEAANARYAEWQDAVKADPAALGTLTTIGVDVGTTGDRTVIARCYDKTRIGPLRFEPKQDTMATTGAVKGVLSANLKARAVVDVIGIGAGVVDRLREQQMKVQPFNAGERAESGGKPMTDRSGEMEFVNKRAAAWWNLRELLEPGSDAQIALPPDDLLTGDLTAPKWRTQSNGKILIESKEEIRKRLGRSTDAADAVVQALYPEEHRPVAVSLTQKKYSVKT